MRACVLLLIMLLFGAAVEVRAQVRVRASVDNRTVTVGQYVRFRVDIEQAPFFGDTPEPPEVEGLELARPFPSSSRRVSIVNGQMKQALSFEWLFRAVQPGTARIGAMEIRISDQVYRTAPIEVEVFGNQPPVSTQPPASAREAPPMREAVFIRPEVSRRTAVRNEQILLTYRLYFREGYRLRGNRMADSWDATGFWKEEMEVPFSPTATEEVIDGLRYYTFPIKRYALFPVQTGTLRIEPFRMETEVARPITRDPFEQLFMNFSGQFEPVVVEAPPVTIEVRPLPPGAPEGFRGAVGTYRLKARLSPRQVATGTPVTLEVTVSGTGNLATLELPELKLPPEIEVYDPAVQTDINRGGTRISGSKTFTYVLVPRQGGRFALPELRFVYYDPDRKTYRVRTAPLGTLEVTGEATPVPEPAEPVPEVTGEPTHVAWWLWGGGALLALLTAAIGVVGLRRRQRQGGKEGSPDPRKAHPEARRALKEAERLRRQGDYRACYEAVLQALQRFVALRMGLPEKGWTRPQLQAHMERSGVSESLRLQLHVLLDECDRALFAPVPPSPEEADSITRRAAELIAGLDRELPVGVERK